MGKITTTTCQHDARLKAAFKSLLLGLIPRPRLLAKASSGSADSLSSRTVKHQAKISVLKTKKAMAKIRSAGTYPKIVPSRSCIKVNFGPSGGSLTFSSAWGLQFRLWFAPIQPSLAIFRERRTGSRPCSMPFQDLDFPL